MLCANFLFDSGFQANQRLKFGDVTICNFLVQQKRIKLHIEA